MHTHAHTHYVDVQRRPDTSINTIIDYTNRVQVVDLMIMLVVLGTVLVVLVVVRAQLEDVRQRREQEQYDFQHKLLRGADAHDERQDPEQLHFDQLYDQHDGEERQQQLVAEQFLCVARDNLIAINMLARQACARREKLKHSTVKRIDR